MICLGAELSHCVYPVSATQRPRFILRFFLSGLLSPTGPPANAIPMPASWQEEASRPLLPIPWGRAAAGAGGRTSPLLPLEAAPSSSGLPSQLGAALLDSNAGAGCAMIPVPEPLWLGPPSHWGPARSDWLVLVTSSCFLICISVPSFLEGRARAILCACLLLLLWLVLLIATAASLLPAVTTNLS